MISNYSHYLPNIKIQMPLLNDDTTLPDAQSTLLAKLVPLSNAWGRSTCFGLFPKILPIYISKTTIKSIQPHTFHLCLLLFLVTQCLTVAIQRFVERISLTKWTLKKITKTAQYTHIFPNFFFKLYLIKKLQRKKMELLPF